MAVPGRGAQWSSSQRETLPESGSDGLFAQVIDDTCGHTLVAASTLDPQVRGELANLPKVEEAARVGRLIAERAKAAGVSRVVFDRGGFMYHGRVAAVADAAREAGLEF